MKKKRQENQCIANAGTENYMAPPTIATVGITNDMKAVLLMKVMSLIDQWNMKLQIKI